MGLIFVALTLTFGSLISPLVAALGPMGMNMPEDSQRHPAKRGPGHRSMGRLVFAGGYGLILVLVVFTYVAAVSFPTKPGHSVVLADR